MKLIVGLGNPGSQYTHTRHNIGFVMIDRLQENLNFPKRQLDTKANAYTSTDTIDGQKVILCKPQTFMNLSGLSVSQISHFLKIEPKDILVLHDEIDLPHAQIEYKVGGGHAGHNGIRNIIEKLGTNTFARIRIGVGRPTTKEEVVDYVLSPFTQGELQMIQGHDNRIKQYVDTFLTQT